jgi:putative membrane protein
MLVAAASLLLSAVSGGVQWIISFPPAFIAFLFSAFVASSSLTLAERKKSIATFRRAGSALLAGEAVWIFCVVCGRIYSWLSTSPQALVNAIMFGAFLSAGFEFVIIRSAFTKMTPLALGLAAVHPASTFAILGLPGALGHFDPLALGAGAVAYAAIAGFVLFLRGKKTSRGHSALDLFRAFMKTWTTGETSDLEAIIADHSEEAEVVAGVLKFQARTDTIFIVLPGVHPGPFHPIGSYDLPGVLSRAFTGLGHVMTLHQPGGHERNLATTSETQSFATRLMEFAKTIHPTESGALMRGPLYTKVGKASASAVAFSNDMVLTISFAPFGSDDLSAQIDADFAKLGSSVGLQAYTVDAHNSIHLEQEAPDMGDPGWKELFRRVGLDEAKQFRVSYVHSSELRFPEGGDLTENGIGLLMVEARGVRSVLVLADSNNAVPSLREAVVNALGPTGCGLIEFCTSDSHNLAARGLTVSRGYKALGEETRVESIARLVADMAKLADTRLEPTAYGSGRLVSRARLFGSKALEEFAAITQASSNLGRRYFRFAVVAVGALLALSIIL